MSTYRELVYMVSDELLNFSDDSTINEEHIIFLLDKYRALLLKKAYELKSYIPRSAYQTLCIELEEVNGINGDSCSGIYLRSKEEIPYIVPVGDPMLTSDFINQGVLTYVNMERFIYTGNNKYLSRFIYCTLGNDNKLWVKSVNPQFTHLERVKFTAVFEDASKAAELECNSSGTSNCDVLDSDFPIEESLIPLLIEACLKELLGASYRPKDDTNDAHSDLNDLASFLRRNLKSGLLKLIEE